MTVGRKAIRPVLRLFCALTMAGISGSLQAGAFEFHWPSARAAGMGGACIAATDPSAIACNPGALALMKKKKGAAVGMETGAFNESLYQGLPPGVGAGTAAEQKTPLSFVPHLYATVPFGKSAVLGTALYHPYREHTEWKSPDAFAGRFLATRSEIDAFDFTTALATPLTPSIGVGGSLIYRSSNISASRRIAADLSGTQREVASVSMKSDTKRSLGWSAGILAKAGSTLSAGFTYQSPIDTDYNGTGSLTQIATGDAQFDALIKASFPFGQDLPITTRLKFPAQAAFGVAWNPSKPWLFALDAGRTQWSQTDDIGIVFPTNHAFDTTYHMTLQDTWTWRAGGRFRFPTGPEVRVGYALEKSPLTDESVSPFFPDADRTTVTAGFGLDWLDVAFGYTTYKQRIIRTNPDLFNGNYRASSWMAMLTVTK